jgi:hypothetical protein
MIRMKVTEDIELLELGIGAVEIIIDSDPDYDRIFHKASCIRLSID